MLPQGNPDRVRKADFIQRDKYERKKRKEEYDLESEWKDHRDSWLVGKIYIYKENNRIDRFNNRKDT